MQMTHLVTYQSSLGPGHIVNGSRDFELPQGFTPKAHESIKAILAEQNGAPTIVTNVIAYDVPNAKVIEALTAVADELGGVTTIADVRRIAAMIRKQAA